MKKLKLILYSYLIVNLYLVVCFVNEIYDFKLNLFKLSFLFNYSNLWTLVVLSIYNFIFAVIFLTIILYSIEKKLKNELQLKALLLFIFLTSLFMFIFSLMLINKFSDVKLFKDVF